MRYPRAALVLVRAGHKRGTKEMADARWYKGSLHAHTTRSSGDASPEVVAKWFADNGYDWLVISDHNLMTILESPTRPLMITG